MTQPPNQLKIGTVLLNTATGDNLGAVVNIVPSTQTIILFRVDKKVHPTFSKIKLSDIINSPITPAGNINNSQYGDLKIQLLKYYRTRNLSAIEHKIMEPLMIYAFPNGIPLYNSENILQDDTIRHMGLRDKIRAGASFYINTSEASTFPHLDNKTVWIIKQDTKGIWVCDDLKCINQPAFSYIPYKDPDVPTFYGISKMISSKPDSPNSENDFIALKNVFDKSIVDKTLLSQIIHDNIRMKVDPAQNNLILMPHKYSGQCYNFNLGRICTDNSESANDARTQLYTNEPIVPTSTYASDSNDNSASAVIQLEPADPVLVNWLNKLDAFKSKESIKLADENGNSGIMQNSRRDAIIMQYGGGVKNAESSDQESASVIMDEDLAAILNTDSAVGASSQPGGTIIEDDGTEINNSDFSEFEEVEGELIEEVGQYQKVRMLPVPELMRTYKESIQRGQIQKQKVERLPMLLRENEYYLNKIKKEVNIISLIKSQITLENKSVKLPVPDFKPLVEKYMNRNFANNNFLIPLVISTRKIFLTRRDKASADDYNTNSTMVIPEFFKHINDIEKEKQLGGSRRLINLDEELGKQTTLQAPYITHQSSVGMLIRVGEKINPDAVQNPDTTPKLKITRARENLELDTQDTFVIQYGQKPFEIENFGLAKSNFDSFVALGPLRRFINEESQELTVEQLEALEEQIDRNMEVISSQYKTYYYGDNINLVGFVRPPIKHIWDSAVPHGTDNGDASISADLMNEDNVIVRYLNKIRSRAENSNNTNNIVPGDDEISPLDEPDKYIMYLFPTLQQKQKEITLNETRLKRYLDRAIPTIDQITELYTKTWSINNSTDMHKLIDILAKFDYYYQNGEAQQNIASRIYNSKSGLLQSKLSQSDYEATLAKIEAQLVESMTEYSNKMDKLVKLKVYKEKKGKERDGLNKSAGSSNNKSIATVITDDIIELADKIYGEKFEIMSGGSEVKIAGTDEYRLDYYAKQDPDNGRLMNLLLRQKAYKDFETHNNKEKLENTLFVLKNKYESLAANNNSILANSQLPADVVDKLKACNSRLDRKPKIIRYPSLERLKEDNGKIITNTRGEAIISGDFAVVDDAGQKLIFKRETLVEGDYWIAQPISVLESLLLKKKREDCESGLSDEQKSEMRAKMQLPGEQLTGTESDPNKKKEMSPEEIDKCTFNPDKLTCLPAELNSSDLELKDLEARIRDVKAELDYVISVPVLLAENNKGMQLIESDIRNYLTGLQELNKFYEDKHLAEQRTLEALIKRRRACSHFQVVDYLFGLANLSDMERLGLAKQIIDRFQNTEQVDNLLLDVLEPDNKNNNLECYICNQTLLCKHYAYSIKLVEESPNGVLDDKALCALYGEENGLSYYCKICGALLANTDVLDVEEFEKAGAKEGMHIKTREVLETTNIIEKQQAAIEKIMMDALQTETNEDITLKLRIFKLLKSLCGIPRLSMDDEVEMVNFLKSYTTGITRKALYNMFFIQFYKAGKQVSPAVIDKLAESEYWKYITADIMCRTLVVLQTSRTVYSVYNKSLSSEFMGWPLFGSSRDTELAGIDLMFGCAKQMIINPDFAYLNSGAGNIEVFRNFLITRMDELIKNDELVRTRLDRALDEKYKMITMLEEKEAHITNFWRGFKPSMSMTTDVGWSPPHDITPAIQHEWTSKTIANILGAGRDNIIYQAQHLKHNITSEVKKYTPTTRLTLNTNLVNGFSPIDYSSIDSSTPGKIKPVGGSAGAISTGNKTDYNYYFNLMRANDHIQANINKIKSYTAILDNLQLQLATYKYIIKMPESYMPYSTINFDIKLDEAQLKEFFLKYIDNGINMGETHLFDPYGRCLISNQLKTDVLVMKYSQSDFERLLRHVYSKNKQLDVNLVQDPEHLLDINKYEASQLVIKLLGQLRALNNELAPQLPRDVVKMITKISINMQSALAPKLIEEVHYEVECMLKIQALVDDYNVVVSILNIISANRPVIEELLSSKLEHFTTYLHELLEIINKTCYDVVLEYLKTGIVSRESFKFQDAKKQYFGLISKIDTEIQAVISGILDDLGLSKKEEVDVETFLVNMGDLKDIKQDYKQYLTKQEQILSRVNYVNLDFETERQAMNTRADMIKKHFRDSRIISSNIKNGSWSGLKSSADIQESHNAEFFKYKDNSKLFGRVCSIINVYTSIINVLTTGDNYRVIGPDMVVAMSQYLFLMMLDSIITINGTKSYKESTLILSSIKESEESGFAAKMKAKNMNAALTDMFEPGATNMEPDEEPAGEPAPASEEESGSETELLPAEDKNIKVPDNVEMALVPDFSNEPGDEEEYMEEYDSHIPDFATKLIKSQQTQRDILINFVKDLLVNIKGLEYLYNEMNLKRISEEKARTIEKQKRQNLNAFKFAGKEGMEDDYRMIQNMRAIGTIDYRNLDETMRQLFGEDYYNEDMQELQSETRVVEQPDDTGYDNLDQINAQAQARQNRLGLDDYEMDELGTVGVAEDMEEQDYGYIAVDES